MFFRRKRYEGMDRYAFQPWYVKAWRYVRYRPYSLLEFCWSLLSWGSTGFSVEAEKHIDEDTGKEFVLNWTRGQMLKHLWTMSRSTYSYNSGQYMSFDELRYELKTGKHWTEMYRTGPEDQAAQGQD